MATDKKINYEMQGKVRNYLGKQKMVKAPLHWRSGPKHPPTELAYITKKEKDLLIKKDLHKTLKGGANRGPSNITSLNGWGDKGEGMADKSYGGQEKPGGNVSVTTGSPHTEGPRTVSQYRPTVSPKDTFQQSWTGPKGWFGGGGYRDLKVAGDTSQGHKSRFGGILRGLGRGALSLFGGIPGKIASGVMGLKNIGKHKTLSDWWSANQPVEEEEDITSDYQINPETKEYKYVGPQLDYAKEFSQTHPLDLSTGVKDGGRIGYNRGRVVNPGGYQGDEFEDENTLEFMQDQGVPFSEMAEGESPFEMRIQELMDKHNMSYEDAYEIAKEEFGQVAEGPEESFSEEGIASLV